MTSQLQLKGAKVQRSWMLQTQGCKSTKVVDAAKLGMQSTKVISTEVQVHSFLHGTYQGRSQDFREEGAKDIIMRAKRAKILNRKPRPLIKSRENGSFVRVYCNIDKQN